MALGLLGFNIVAHSGRFESLDLMPPEKFCKIADRCLLVLYYYIHFGKFC
jgi:hypothetical protein